VCLWCAGVPLLSLDIFHDGDWGMGLLSCWLLLLQACKSAKLLCPVLLSLCFLVPAGGEEERSPSNEESFSRSRSRAALLLVSSSLVGVACKWPTGRSAGRIERKPCCGSAQLSSAQPWTCTKATATSICTGFGLWGSDDDSAAWLLDVPNPFGEGEAGPAGKSRAAASSPQSAVHSGLV